jgi:hypothetical protein
LKSYLTTCLTAPLKNVAATTLSPSERSTTAPPGGPASQSPPGDRRTDTHHARDRAVASDKNPARPPRGCACFAARDRELSARPRRPPILAARTQEPT